jgi:polysaccharide lyase-like protein
MLSHIRSFVPAILLGVAASCATAGTSDNPDAATAGDAASPALGNDGAAVADGSGGTEGGALGDDGSQPSMNPIPAPDDAASEAAQVPEGGGGGCASAPAIHDDFESASLGTWQATDPYGNPLTAGSTQYSAAIDTTRAHSGTHSVKVHNGLIGMAPPAGAFYGRAWAWFGSSPGSVPSGGHWGSFIGVGRGDSGTPVEVRMGGQFGILIYNYSTNDDVVLSDPNFFNDGMDAGTSLVVGKWTCFEFYFGKDSLRTWVDGAEVTTLNVTPSTVWAHGMKAPWSPAYSSIRIGYANYNAAAIDVWYDDVAFDTSRICCQ